MYLIQKDLDRADVEMPISRALVGCLDSHVLNQLTQTASSRLGAYLKLTQAARIATSQSILEKCLHQPAPRFLKYLVVLDLFRDTLLGESFQDTCCDIEREYGEQPDAAALAAVKESHADIFALLVDRIAAFQQLSPCEVTPVTRATTSSSSDNNKANLPTWVAPVKLDVDDMNTLFLHEANSESGADISSEDTHVFPPPGESLFGATEATIERTENRLVHQDAESYVVSTADGGSQRLWVVANYYETMHLFAVFDADLVTLEAVERDMDCIGAFGGYADR